MKKNMLLVYRTLIRISSIIIEISKTKQKCERYYFSFHLVLASYKLC